MTIAVLGAGAFGTALALALLSKGKVVLWTRDAAQAKTMRETRENRRRLPGIPLPTTLEITDDIGAACKADILLIAVPMQKLRGFMETHAQHLKERQLVACCKGMELGSGAGPAEILSETSPGSVIALLTGPSFASDIAQGKPTALTLACADEKAGEELQLRLSTPTLRLYRSADVPGASLGGALKNVIAIACGATMGAGLGESARAALITRGAAEMQRLARHRGADPRTVSGLSGFGDLVLTCTSGQSRNYRLGVSIGSGTEFDRGTTVEGAATAIAVEQYGRAERLDLPISQVVASLVQNRMDVTDAMEKLLSRTLKEE